MIHSYVVQTKVTQIFERIDRLEGNASGPKNVQEVATVAKLFDNVTIEESFGPTEIDPHEIEYNEQKDFLGQGSFGRVYAGLCRGKRVAVKVPLKQGNQSSSRNVFLTSDYRAHREGT